MNHAAAILLGVTIKSALVLLLALLLNASLRRASAASRHALWLATIGALACLPLLSLSGPKVAVRVLPAAKPSFQPQFPTSDAQNAFPSLKPPASALRSDAPFSTPSGPAATSIHGGVPTLAPGLLMGARSLSVVPAASAISPAGWLLLVWIAGVGVMLARMLLGFSGARRLVRSCQPILSGGFQEKVDKARRRLSVARSVDLRIGWSEAAPSVPMTCGAARPMILLPPAAREWPTERLEAAILHEMAHIRRRDWLTMVLTQIVLALYWWNPLAWIAARQLRIESEQACDDLVLGGGMNAADYAAHLLEVARELTVGERPVAALAMAQPREIAQRLESILANHRDRRGVTRGGFTLAGLLLIGAGSLAVVHLAARAQAQKNIASHGAGRALSNAVTLSLMQTLQTGADFNCIAFTPDSRRILAGSWSHFRGLSQGTYGDDGRLTFWNVNTGKQTLDRPVTAPLMQVAYSPDGRYLATGYAGGDLRISDSATGHTLHQLHLAHPSIDLLQFSPDSKTLACGASNPGEPGAGNTLLSLIDPAAGKSRQTGYHGIFRRFAHEWTGSPFTGGSQSGRLATWDGGVSLWSPSWGQPTIEFDKTSARTCAVHGNLVAALDRDTIHFWDARTRQEVGTIGVGGLSDTDVPHLAFSPDGQYLAFGGDGAIKVWRVTNSAS